MPSNKGAGSSRHDWMDQTGGGSRKSSYTREPVRSDKGRPSRESDYTAEKMDKGLPLKKGY